MVSAFSSTSATALALNVSGALVKRVDDGFSSTTLTTSPTPTIEPRSVTGNYRILSGRSVEVHSDFGTFVQALNDRIGVDATVRAVLAFGDFSAPTQILSADAVTVHLR